MSLSQHTLKDGSSKKKKMAAQSQPQELAGQHHRNCQEEKAMACRRKQIDSRVGDSGSDYVLDIVPTSLHLGLLERQRGRAEFLLLLAITCWNISRN